MNHVTLSHCDIIHVCIHFTNIPTFSNTTDDKSGLNLTMEHHGNGTSQIMKHDGNPKVDNKAGDHNQRQHFSLWTR